MYGHKSLGYICRKFSLYQRVVLIEKMWIDRHLMPINVVEIIIIVINRSMLYIFATFQKMFAKQFFVLVLLKTTI